MKMKKSVWSVMIGVFLLGSLPLLAASEDEGYALLIQQSPPDAGFVTPGNGVHKTTIGETVTLSAVPKPGYRFMYWLGDVENSSALDTTIAVDSPKMVVAIFARENHEALPGIGVTDGDHYQGPNHMVASPVQAGAPINPGGDTPDTPEYPEDPDDPDFPVVPEPATMMLFGLGSLLALKRKK